MYMYMLHTYMSSTGHCISFLAMYCRYTCTCTCGYSTHDMYMYMWLFYTRHVHVYMYNTSPISSPSSEVRLQASRLCLLWESLRGLPCNLSRMYFGIFQRTCRWTNHWPSTSYSLSPDKFKHQTIIITHTRSKHSILYTYKCTRTMQ